MGCCPPHSRSIRTSICHKTRHNKTFSDTDETSNKTVITAAAKAFSRQLSHPCPVYFFHWHETCNRSLQQHTNEPGRKPEVPPETAELHTRHRVRKKCATFAQEFQTNYLIINTNAKRKIPVLSTSINAHAHGHDPHLHSFQ